MAKLKWVSIVLSLCVGLAVAQEENCDTEKWLPEGQGTSHEECVEYDGSLVPDCGEFLQNNVTAYFHVHEYNCSRFWECSPQGACLTSCAPCGAQCGNYDGLVFDCRYKYPMGPVCDYPANVDCTNGYSTTDRNPTGPTIKPTTPATPTPATPTAPTTPTTETTTIQTTPTEAPGCLTDDDCESDEWCDTSVTPGECKPGCRTSDDCTAMSCSECVNHQCVDPECCTSDDCEAVTDMVCSVCNIDTCSQPECCADDDCLAGYICEDEKCVPEGECDAMRPCDGVDGICDLPSYDNCEYCDLDTNECKPGCDHDDNCLGGMVTCSDHKCSQVGNTGLTNITINTETCSQCPGSGNPLGTVEGGLMVTLLGEYGTSCQSGGLDNLEHVDYDNGKSSFFDGAPEDDGDDDGLGGCKNADLNYGLTGGSATWVGKGIWTGAASETICINFYDPDNNKPTCCCNLAMSTLEQDESSELTGCVCAM